MNFETRIATANSGSDYSDPSAADSRRKKIMIAVVIVAVLAFALAAYMMNRGGDSVATAKAGNAAGGKSADKQAPTVSVVIPGRQQVPTIISATGSLAARREMPVGVVGEGGMVQRVLVEPGQWVGAGQVLAVIERSVQAQELNQLAAQINVAQADARLAQAELERAQSLVSRGFVSKADIDRKTATRDAARARVAVAQAQLGASRARTGRLDIRSPAAGLILTRAVEPGQVVSAGSGVLFRVAKGGEMELRALLSDADLSKLSVGLPVQVTPVGSSVAINAQIWQLSPVIDPQSRQGIARIAVPYSAAIRPGGFAAAKITAGNADTPLLPGSAVLSDPKGNYVLVVGEKNLVERRDVVVGAVTDVGASIVSGLDGSEKVVVSAGGFLNPGEQVIPAIQKTGAR
jgi:RND family efflux transporter MFP subunit